MNTNTQDNMPESEASQIQTVIPPPVTAASEKQPATKTSHFFRHAHDAQAPGSQQVSFLRGRLISEDGQFVIQIVDEQTNSEKSTAAQSNDLVPGSKYMDVAKRVVYGQGPDEDMDGKYKKFNKFKIDLRRYLAELEGSFFLVFFHASMTASSAWFQSNGGPAISPEAYGILYGFIILALIFALGAVSGAHFNPIVTFAFALRGIFTWWRVPIYWLAQLVGSLIGAVLTLAIFGQEIGNLGSNIPPSYSTVYRAFGTEIIGSYFFLTVVFSTARASKLAGPSAAIAVGAAYTAISVFASYVSTISLNPFRSLATAIVAGAGPQWVNIWPFICGPVIGCLLAVGCDRIIASARGQDYKKRHTTHGSGGKSSLE